jgi:hypothetical protein
MTSEKQTKAYGALMVLVVILMLGAQFGLQFIFRQSSDELVSLRTSVESDKRALTNQQSLSSRFESFRTLALGQSGSDRQFPISGIELYTALSNVLRDYQIDFSNATPNSGVQPGASFTLQIRFSGPYYNVIKALASIRDSNYIMRISNLTINAEGGGNVSGTMNVVSTARIQG